MARVQSGQLRCPKGSREAGQVAEALRLRGRLANLRNLQLPRLSERVGVLEGKLCCATTSLCENPQEYEQFRKLLLLELLDWTANTAAAEAILDIANDLKAELLQPREGEPYSAEFHELLRVDRTTAADDGNRVSRCLSPGLLLGGKVLRKAEVSVYR